MSLWSSLLETHKACLSIYPYTLLALERLITKRWLELTFSFSVRMFSRAQSSFSCRWPTTVTWPLLIILRFSEWLRSLSESSVSKVFRISSRETSWLLFMFVSCSDCSEARSKSYRYQEEDKDLIIVEQTF